MEGDGSGLAVPVTAKIANARTGRKEKQFVAPTLYPGPKKRHYRLIVPATIQVGGGPEKEVKLFVDTGSEVDLIRPGLVDAALFVKAKQPIRLSAANSGLIAGGKLEVQVNIRLFGVDSDRKSKVAITTPTVLYDASVDDDITLSYLWLAERGFDVYADRHGLMGHVDGRRVWIGGLQEIYTAAYVRQPVCVRACPIRSDRKALDLFCGQKSAARVLEQHGFHVETLDNDPERDPSICTNIMEWDYRSAFQPGHFHIITAAPPCTEYSAAKWRPPRDPESADPVVKKTLEVIEYFQPEIWWLETPRNGLLARRDFMQSYPFVDCDHCQFEDRGYQKPTRFFGSVHLAALKPVLCDGRTCPSLEPPEEGHPGKRRGHRNRLGGNRGCAKKETTYYIPPDLVEYVSGLGTHFLDDSQEEKKLAKLSRKKMGIPVVLDQDDLEEIARVRCMQLRIATDVDGDDEPLEDDEVLWEVAQRINEAEKRVCAVGVVERPPEDPLADLARELQEALLAEFGDSSLSGKYPAHPLPVRGPYGEGEIWLQPDAKPVSVPPFHLTGERREALDKLVGDCIAQGKMESGRGAWNTPAFPVPKKVPGTYRLVQDLRPQNAVTLKDGHPLPRIGDMVYRQGKNQVWTVLDLVDGFHQMPMKVEHRPITCMSTPRGTQQWTVQVMGLKNAATQFQRMMEWVLQDLPDSDPYVDDTITGSSGVTPAMALWENYYAVKALLRQFREVRIVCKSQKSKFFQPEVEFCGHILREGRRSPAPGKLLPIKNWELPQTVTELRGFLGLTNYFSEYVEHYAESAAPLMGKLQLNKQDGRKGSKLRLVWTDEEVAAFQQLKDKLCKSLELYQPDLDKPFRLHCDASDYAIGAELAQEIGGQWRPVSFYSRKLGKSQKNWTPREKETYAIVASLRKWAGIIGYQPVLITTDHKSLQDWVTEHMDTPSGPRGRRARWHETLSQFDLKVTYVPGPDNVVPDALSRWAYPASSSREDVSFHGSLEAKEEVKRMLEKELAERKVVGMVRLGPPGHGMLWVGGELPPPSDDCSSCPGYPKCL